MRKITLIAILLACLNFTDSFGQENVTTILKENFDRFTEGSESSPYPLGDDYITSTDRFSSLLPEWRGYKLKEAGKTINICDYGYIETPKLDMTANEGVIKVSFRIRSLASYGAYFTVSDGKEPLAEELLRDDKWHTVSYVFNNRKKTSCINISPMLSLYGVLVDDLEITTSPDYLASPEAAQPTVATATSFTAQWEEVMHAEGYILNVYSLDSNGQKTYAIQDLKVNGTSYEVTNLQKGPRYHYNVRAYKGTFISEPSYDITVYPVISQLDAPVAKEATEVSASGFAAHWEPVEFAESYIVSVGKTQTVGTDGPATCLKEDFSGITQGSLEEVVYVENHELDLYTQTKGWTSADIAFASGHVGLIPFMGSSWIKSPELDLSGDNGKFNVKINLSEYDYGVNPLNGAKVYVELHKGDEVLEDKVITLSSKTQEYELEFTKGTAGAKLSVNYNGENRLFIDNMEVIQNKKAGDKIASLVALTEEEGTSHPFNLTLDSHSEYAYKVYAYTPTVDPANGKIIDLYSKASNVISVKLTTGVDSATGQISHSVSANSGILTVNLASNADLKVFDMSGNLLIAEKATAGTHHYTLNAKAVIVKTDGQVFKLLAK